MMKYKTFHSQRDKNISNHQLKSNPIMCSNLTLQTHHISLNN